MNKIIPLIVFGVILLAPSGAFAGPPMNKQITLEDLGILQLAAHDFFLVDRVDEIDFENGLLDLSTLFTDMTSGEPFSDADIAMGGEPRNRENIMLFTVASELGQMYLDLRAVDGAESAKQQTISIYHSMVSSAYENAFDEPLPSAKNGCVTMTENLALRTIHDFLPGMIEVDGQDTDVLGPELVQRIQDGMPLSNSDMQQLSDEVLDGDFDSAFNNIRIIIPPDIDMTIDLEALDSSFAFQFNTDFTFEEFMIETGDGFYNPDEEVTKQVRSLFAKGLGDGCYVGGEFIPIEATSLLISGVQTNLSLIIPAIVIVAGVTAFWIRRE